MSTDWRAAYWNVVDGKPVEVRLNDDGSLDEIVGYGGFHLEQMTNKKWFLSVGGCRLMITGKKMELYPIECETWTEEQKRVANGVRWEPGSNIQ